MTNIVHLYKQAEKFLPWNLEQSIFNSSITPYWHKEALYYFQEIPNENWLIKVNISTGNKEKIFPLSFLIKELNKTFRNVVQKEITDLRVENEPSLRLTFNYLGYFCSYDVSNKTLQKESKNCGLMSPDKKWSLLIQNHNLFLKNLLNQKESQITFDGEEHFDYASSPETNTHTVSDRLNNVLSKPIAIWSHDSNRIITHKLDQRMVEELYLLQNAPKNSQRPKLHKYKMSFSGDTVLPKTDFIIIDLQKKTFKSVKTEALLAPYLTAIEFKWVWWSMDNKKIYFIRETRGAKAIVLCSIDAETGDVTEIISEKAIRTYVEPSSICPWKPQILVLEDRKEIVWLSEMDGYAHLYLYNQESKKIKQQITEGEWCVREVYFYDEENDWLYFSASAFDKKIDPYYKQFFRCHIDGGQIQNLTPEMGCHNIYISSDKTCFLDTYSTISKAPVSVLKKINGKIIEKIETAQTGYLTELNWKPPLRFSVKARDEKTEIYGNLYYPSHFDPQKKYPLIDHIYPGPQIFRTPTQFTLNEARSRNIWFAQALAELGFIVFHIDGLGTPGRSKAFHDFTYQNIGDCGIPDHVTAIKQLISKYSFINQEKIGVIGYSGGGYAAARSILMYPEIFKVAVAAAGNHELRAYPANYGEKYNSLDLSTYQSQSNAALAKNLQGKLLLIHGELDDNVHPCATMQLVDALIENNKDFDLLYMPNQNHQSTYSHPYTLRKNWDYFVEHLLDIKPPKEYNISNISRKFPQLVKA